MPNAPQTGLLVLDGWAGLRKHPVLILGETPKRYRIACVDDTPVRLAGHHRWLRPGQTALVPKYAVQLAPLHDHGVDGS